MGFKKKKGLPWFYVTWLTGVMSGNDSCLFAPWVKGHMWYKKRPRENLETWQAAHAAEVQVVAAAHAAAGRVVQLEDQNAFTLEGRTCILAGKPDIIAWDSSQAYLDDVKTGKKRDAHVWQVRLYLAYAERLWPGLVSGDGVALPIQGRLLYTGDAPLIVPPPTDDQTREIIGSTIRRLASPEQPARVPSVRECRYCDIVECPERLAEDDEDRAFAQVEDF